MTTPAPTSEKVSAMITRPGEQGPSVQTILNRPLGAILSTSDIPYINQVIPESLEAHDDHLCVPRGMAALLKRSLENMCESWGYFMGSKKWRQVGLSAADIERWRMDNAYPFFVVLKHGGRLVKRRVLSEHGSVKGNRSIAFTSAESRIFLQGLAHRIKTHRRRSVGSTTSQQKRLADRTDRSS